MDTPPLIAAVQVGLGGVLVFVTGLLIGSSWGFAQQPDCRVDEDHDAPQWVNRERDESGQHESPPSF